MTKLMYNIIGTGRGVIMAAIYEKLKLMREQSGLRQGQIAEYLGVTQTFISKVETGERNLTAAQLENLVNLYGYSLAAFANEDVVARPIQFAYRAQEVSQADLKVIADISKIVINSQFMTEVLEEMNG